IALVECNNDARRQSRAGFVNTSSMCVQLKSCVFDKHTPGTFVVLHGLQAPITKLDMRIAAWHSHTQQHSECSGSIIHISPTRWASPAPCTCRATCSEERGSE